MLSCEEKYLSVRVPLRSTTSYWRMHWCESPGAKVYFSKRKASYGESTILLVPPNKVISRGLPIPSNHLFTHFTLLNQEHHKLLKDVYVFDCVDQREELDELCLMARRNLWSYGESLRLDAFIMSFLARIPVTDWSPRVKDSRISRVLSMMSEDVSKTRSNERLAADINMSANAFIRFFKKHVGSSPLAYQIRLRLDKAMIQLDYTDKTIEEIAEECGFCDRNYFTKTFKDHLGIPPARYRTQKI